LIIYIKGWKCWS